MSLQTFWEFANMLAFFLDSALSGTALSQAQCCASSWTLTMSGTELSQGERCLVQRWVKLNDAWNRAESRWTMSGTALSQAEWLLVQRWVKLNGFWYSAESSWLLPYIQPWGKLSAVKDSAESKVGTVWDRADAFWYCESLWQRWVTGTALSHNFLFISQNLIWCIWCFTIKVLTPAFFITVGQ